MPQCPDCKNEILANAEPCKIHTGDVECECLTFDKCNEAKLLINSLHSDVIAISKNADMKESRVLFFFLFLLIFAMLSFDHVLSAAFTLASPAWTCYYMYVRKRHSMEVIKEISMNAKYAPLFRPGNAQQCNIRFDDDNDVYNNVLFGADVTQRQNEVLDDTIQTVASNTLECCYCGHVLTKKELLNKSHDACHCHVSDKHVALLTEAQEGITSALIETTQITPSTLMKSGMYRGQCLFAIIASTYLLSSSSVEEVDVVFVLNCCAITMTGLVIKKNDVKNKLNIKMKEINAKIRSNLSYCNAARSCGERESIPVNV